MAQIVINISDDTYYRCKNEKVGLLPFDVPEVCNAIQNGTVLAKGHGRLFDENELKKEAIRCEWSRNMYDMLDHKLSYMKPIIEADKEN